MVSTTSVLKCAARASSTLSNVSVVMRHGYRAPISTYLTDPYPCENTSFWPEGKGELTKMCEIGKMFRAHYTELLANSNQPGHVRARAHDVRRVMKSADSFMRGFLQLDENEKFPTEDIGIPLQQMFTDPNICPAFTALKGELSKKVEKKGQKYSQLLAALSKSSGTEYTTLRQVWIVWDCMIMQIGNGYEPPEWARSRYSELQEASSALMNTLFGDRKTIKFCSGFILNDLLSKFEKVVQTKIDFLFGHDVTIHSLLCALSLDSQVPTVLPGSALIFETHKMAEKNPMIKVLFFNGSPVIRPFAVDDWHKLCKM